MSYVFVIISNTGFILGVTLSRAEAEQIIRSNPHHKECRISHEPVIAR